MENQNATVFFAETKNEAKETLFSCAQTFRGRHIKSIGTTHLFLFDDPQAACEAALKLKKADNPIPFRIGIARGMVSVTPGDAFGDVVNLAARLQGIAKNQEIYISDEVRETVDRFLIPVRSVGSKQFAGAKNPIPVFSVEISAPPLQEAPAKEAPTPAKEIETKPAKELFDFSRVDQERIQDDDAIRAAIPDRVMATNTIPLYKEKSEVLQLKRTKKTAARTQPEHPLVEQKKLEKRKKALLILGILSGAVPALLIGGIWFYYKVLLPATAPVPTHVNERLNQSEAMQALKQPNVERLRARGIYVASYGTLTIKANPPDAQVYINERLVSDKTPVKINKFPARTPVQIRVSKPGYEDNEQFLNIGTDETKEITVNLSKKLRK